MIHKSDPGSTPTSTAQSGDPLDMSMGGVPREWVDAQGQAPIPYGEYETLSRAARFDVIPAGSRGGTFVANAAAVAASLMCGTGWYMLDLAGLYSGPWLAPAVGLIIALTIRITSGAEAAYRTVLSIAAYLLTLTAVLFLLTRRELLGIYGSVDSFQTYENTIVRTRLEDPVHVGAYVLGIYLAAQIGYLRTRR